MMNTHNRGQLVRSRFIPVLLLSLSILGMAACGGTKVERKDVDSTIDLSGRWNDADSRMTAEAMIKDCLSRPWLVRFEERNEGKQPRIIVGTIRNKTSEHIATETFVQDLARELTNSGRAYFVAGGGERDEIREERQDQQYNASSETRKRMREEYGADFMLQGTLNSVIDQVDGKHVILYQVDLFMTDLESNERVWIGNHKIKKFVKNPPARF